MAVDRDRGYGYKEVERDVFFDSEGNRYQVMQRRWRSNKSYGRSRWRDWIVVATDTDGNEISDKTVNVKSVEDAKNKVRQTDTENAIYSGEEFQNKLKADKETKRLDLKAHEAVAQAKQSAMDTTKRQTEIAQQQTARVSGEAIRSQRDALLAQGYNPEEARMMTAQGSEAVARTISDLGQQGMAVQAQTVGNIAQFGAEQGWTAEKLSQGIKQMQQDLMKHRETLANQLRVTGMQTKAQKQAASSAAWGSAAEGLGAALGGQG